MHPTELKIAMATLGVGGGTDVDLKTASQTMAEWQKMFSKVPESVKSVIMAISKVLLCSSGASGSGPIGFVGTLTSDSPNLHNAPRPS